MGSSEKTAVGLINDGARPVGMLSREISPRNKSLLESLGRFGHLGLREDCGSLVHPKYGLK